MKNLLSPLALLAVFGPAALPPAETARAATYRITHNWDKPIHFSGGGAMPFIGIAVSGLQQVAPDLFLVKYRHRDFGGGRIVLDEDALTPVQRDVSVPSEFPGELSRTTIDFPGIGVRLAHDSGRAAETDTQPNTKYVLRWQTLGANHDRPRQPPLPPPSVLQLVKLERP